MNHHEYSNYSAVLWIIIHFPANRFVTISGA